MKAMEKLSDRVLIDRSRSMTYGVLKEVLGVRRDERPAFLCKAVV